MWLIILTVNIRVSESRKLKNNLAMLNFLFSTWFWSSMFEIRLDLITLDVLLAYLSISLPLLVWRMLHSCFWRIIANFDSSDYRTILAQSILNELWYREDGIISGLCSHMAFSCNDKILIYACGCELCS